MIRNSTAAMPPGEESHASVLHSLYPQPAAVMIMPETCEDVVVAFLMNFVLGQPANPKSDDEPVRRKSDAANQLLARKK